MVNRTGTYFAFDGLGQSNPSKSDFKYYATVKLWNAAGGIDFKFVNSHEKASAVRDTSKKSTLEASILQRLRASKTWLLSLVATREKREVCCLSKLKKQLMFTKFR